MPESLHMRKLVFSSACSLHLFVPYCTALSFRQSCKRTLVLQSDTYIFPTEVQLSFKKRLRKVLLLPWNILAMKETKKKNAICRLQTQLIEVKSSSWFLGIRRLVELHLVPHDAIVFLALFLSVADTFCYTLLTTA